MFKSHAIDGRASALRTGQNALARALGATARRGSRFSRLGVAVGATLLIFALAASASAAPPDYIISDSNFRAKNSMSVAEIQAYLNGQPGPLKNLVTSDYDKTITTSSSQPNINLTPDNDGVKKPASQIIWEACQAYNISPMAMLTMLQKEQSLLTRTSLTSTTLARAIGAGCPNGTTNKFPGFGNQMWHGARLLDAYGEPGKSTPYVDLYHPGISVYDIYHSPNIKLYPANIATYKLYVYNPSIDGNTNYYNIYRERFGDPTGNPPRAIPDPRLEAVIRETLGKPAGPLTDYDMTFLTSLNGSARGITELSGLERAVNLTTLYLDGNAITDVTPIAGLTKLTALRLNSNRISNISPVKNLKSLTLLGLCNNPISSIAPVSGLTNLQDLWLGGCWISDVTPVSGLTNLKDLWLFGNRLTTVAPLSSLTQLTALRLNDNRISDLAPIAGLTNLTSLLLDDCLITDATSLSALTDLATLDVDGNRITDVSPLAGLTEMTVLDVSDNRVADIAPLSAMAALTSLDVSRNYLDLTPGGDTMDAIAAHQTGGATVTFEPQKNSTTYAITPTSSANGTTTPSTTQTVDAGSDQCFLIRPNAGYHVADVKIDGSSIGPVARYRFTSVAASHTIEARFAQTTYKPIYRFYNKKNGSHFYTASESEKATVIATLGGTYSYDGPAYKASSAYGTPLYRFYNKTNGSHFYTASKTERDRVIATLGTMYSYDGPAYNVTAGVMEGSAPLYRFYNKTNGSHFYTASMAEKSSVYINLSQTYQLEGLAFFVAP